MKRHHNAECLRVGLLALLVSSVLLGGGSSAGGEVGSGEWLEVRTPSFAVISKAGYEKALDVARAFERIRASYKAMLPDARTETPRPVVILVVEDEGGVRELMPHYWEGKRQVHPVGGFLRGARQFYIVIRADAPGRNPYQVVYHEYFHVLMSLNVPDAPVWLDEGLAEFWARTELQGTKTRLGRPNAEHLRLLRERDLLPVSVLIAVDRRSPQYRQSGQASLFYAQSWIMAHYIMLGDSTGSARRALARYLGLLKRGAPHREAFESTLGDPEAWQERLAHYARQRRFHAYELEHVETHEKALWKPRSLSVTDAALLRSAFLVESGRLKEAQTLLEHAVGGDPSAPDSLPSMGLFHLRRGEPSKAGRSLDEAVGRILRFERLASNPGVE